MVLRYVIILFDINEHSALYILYFTVVEIFTCSHLVHKLLNLQLIRFVIYSQVTKLENYGYADSSSSSSYPYLTLPESYNGNQLTSYGGYIRYKVSPQSPRLSSGFDNMPDIIIKVSDRY